MYKIYINENPLLLCRSSQLNRIENREQWEMIPYTGDVGILSEGIDLLERTNGGRQIVYHSPDFIGLKVDFKGLFLKIGAAGGVVEDEEEKVLFIYRRGCWDLPKGKREKGEKKRECALREVEEETGLKDLFIVKKIGKTRHVYRDPKTEKRILKLTHWYKMKAGNDLRLRLQKEEDIMDAKWIYAREFIAENYPTFANIKSLLEGYLVKESHIKQNL